MTASIIYQGELRCMATHLQSGTILETDAPTDNRGKGARFSPTDLVCVALGTCIITTIAMKAMDLNINLDESAVEITKYMKSEPRRIGKIEIKITLTDKTLDEKTRNILERIGNNCPVFLSLHPEIEMHVDYVW
jgi:uncharacterized OsmC-like protein